MSLFRNGLYIVSHLSKILISSQQTRSVKRWVGPTLRELRHRKIKMGVQPENHRSSFIEWNYNSEIFAFGKRLNEDFNTELLHRAFVNRSYIKQEEAKQRNVGIENPELNIQDNTSLVKRGDKLIRDYVGAFLKFSFPKLPDDGIKSLHAYLTSDDSLANISEHIGAKYLILSADFPVAQSTLTETFKAIVAALAESSGDEKAFTFIRDFVCTQLNQKLVSDIWTIENPYSRLEKVIKKQSLPKIEPRLLGEIGKNTVLAAYHVGIYSDKKLIGKGFGETIETAKNEAALNALRKIFGAQDNAAAPNFLIEIESISQNFHQLR